MRQLPALVFGACRGALPLSDHSAAALAEFLLAARTERSSIRLAELLAEDSVLLLWTICVAHTREGFKPKTVGDAAEWLARQVLDILQWPEGDCDAAFSTDREKWADRVANAFQV